jgi:hypothetical protein
MPLGDSLLTGSGFDFGDDFWGGGLQTASGVPGRTAVSLAGIGFEIDVKQLKGGTIPSQRGSTDTSAEPSEAALNPEGIWTRQQQDWSWGEGLVFFDRTPERRRSYKIRGAEWTSQDNVAVGQRFEQQENITATRQFFMKAGSWYYWYNGTTLRLTQTPTLAAASWTAATTFTGTPNAIAHDGTRVYLATSTGLFTAAIGTAAIAATAIVAGVDNVAYVQNHLVIGQANVLKELDAAFAATVISTHYSTAFRWTVIAGGNGAIFAGGSVGGVSELYALAVSQTTGALQKTIAAATLLPDEVLYTILVYGQKAVLGTSLGVRVGDIVSMGGISYGAATGTGDCRCLAGYAQFVYFGATNVDGVTSGIGRMDLSTAVDAEANQFAYAVDALPTVGTTANYVAGIAALANGEVWGVVDQKGIYHKIANTVFTSGVATVETGWMAYNTIENKTLVDLDVGSYLPTTFDSIQIDMSVDGSTWTAIGLATLTQVPPFALTVPQARRFKLRFTITAGAGRPTSTPFPYMTFWSVRIMPAPRRSQQLRLPLQIAQTVDAGFGEGQPQGYPDPEAVYNSLMAICTKGDLTSLQMGVNSFVCKINDLEREHHRWADGYKGLDGIIFATVTIP